MFDPNLVYPSDPYGGSYMDLNGVIESVNSEFKEKGDDVCAYVKVENKTYMAFFTYHSHLPSVGDNATVRVYRSGGGWYPDDRLISWGK